MAQQTEVRTNLAKLRVQRGFGAAQLAAKVGISRQTVYAIESGAYVPNTLVGLKLARVLDTTVEEIFQIATEEYAEEETALATILGDPTGMEPGQPLLLCTVNDQLVAVAPEEASWGLHPADAVLVDPLGGPKTLPKATVRMLSDKWKKSARILLAGCDPSVSFLAQAMQAQGCELIVTYQNSTRALDLLHSGLVHIAGTHLTDKTTGKEGFSVVTKGFPRNSVAVFSYAIWEEGLVVATGNPKKITSVADLVRHRVRFTNREPGAGCRRLLDDLLRKAGIAAAKIEGYDKITPGHLQAARMVRAGDVDCCISTQGVARALSLDFVPLARKPYQLVLHRKHLKHPAIHVLFETLGRASFRREVEACTGYIMRAAGDRLI